MRYFANYVLTVAAVSAALVGLVAAIMWAANLPVVYESWKTGECVAVEDPAGTHSCDNPPAKFFHEWTE